MNDSDHLQELRKLEALRQHLDVAEHLDEESRRLLSEVTSEIEAAMREGPERLGDESFTSPLVKAARDFESHHPAFSRTLESIVDLLGQFGI